MQHHLPFQIIISKSTEGLIDMPPIVRDSTDTDSLVTAPVPSTSHSTFADRYNVNLLIALEYLHLPTDLLEREEV